MGAWGHQLTANDRALDLIDEMAEHQSKFLVKCFNDDSQDSFGRLGLLEAALSGLGSWHVFYSLKETNVVDRALYDIEFLLQSKE